MSAYTSKKLAFNNAEQFKESFFEPEPATVGYVFIGNHLPWTNDDVADDIFDTVADEKYTWDNMYAAKLITGNDVELVVPKITWQNETKYRQFDDTIEPSELLSANTEQGLFPMYVINSERNVYLCVCNNVSAISTIEPTGKNLTANGNIQTGDGYLWKYLYNVRSSNKFLTDEWIPAPTSTDFLDYDTSSVISVDGELAKIVMTNRGSGYLNSTITVSPFTTGCTVLSVVSSSDNTRPLLSEAVTSILNMSLTGNGIGGGTFVSAVDGVSLRITLSSPTVSNGGGLVIENTLNVSTRVLITGDGTGAIGTTELDGSQVRKIILTNYGSDYSFANVNIFGTGTGATARAVLPPKFGHGYNAAKQLGASNVMISMKIGEIDSTENGLISVDTTFRQYGLLRDPYKYGSSQQVTKFTANTVISQTTDVLLIAGPEYDLNEFVFQGTSPNNATFSGFVNDFTSNEVRLTRVRGTPQIGLPLKGVSSNPGGRTIVNISRPEFEPYTGDILFVDNIIKTQRTDGQAENIKFVVKF
jgi:hypothetical protein